MQVVFVLLMIFLLIGLFARDFTRRVRWLLILSIIAMIALITFTPLGG
jgi:hypothetical protein